MSQAASIIEQIAASENLVPGTVVIRSEYQGKPVAMTLADLQHEVERLAKQLRQRGVKRLGLYASNSPAWLVVDLAAQAAGVVLVPLPGFFSRQQLLHCLQSSGCDAVFCEHYTQLAQFQGQQADDFQANESQQSVFVWQVNMGNASFYPLYMGQFDASKVELPEGTEKITYTSGSTGQPKGVCLSASSQLRVARSIIQASAIKKPQHLAVLPLSTLLENVAGAYLALLAGGCVTLLEPAALGFDGNEFVAERLVKKLHELEPNTLIVLPGILPALCEAAEAGDSLPDSLQFIAVGGARVPARLIERARAVGLPVYEGYGFSECGSVVSLNTEKHYFPGSTGKLLPHVEVKIIDDEIHVSGNAFLGYVGDRNSWYQKTVASGDLGRIDENGFLHIDGRRKNLLINAWGRNINPEWVESELLANGLLQQAVVFAEQQTACVALLVASPGTTSQELEQWLATVNSQLPVYAQIRAWLQLEFPFDAAHGLLTANGKPRREAIADYYASELEQLFEQTQQDLVTNHRPVKEAIQ